MNTRNTKLSARSKSLAALALAGALAGVLSGCSGGNAISTSKTVSGTLLDSSKAPIAHAKAVFDSGSAGALTTTTSTAGAYTFAVPLGSITGSDTIMFYNSAGELIDIESISLSKNTDSTTLTTTSPPVPPIPPPTL